MPQPVRPARIHVRTPGTQSRAGPLFPVGMVAPEIQPIRDLVERTLQGNLGSYSPIRVVVAAVQCGAAQDVRPHDAVNIITPIGEEHATKALGPPQRDRGQRIFKQSSQPCQNHRLLPSRNGASTT